MPSGMYGTSFYERLRKETEIKVQTYNEFFELIETTKKSMEEQIDKIKSDMKFISKQIESNNKMLNIQGLEPVKFDKK